MCGISIIYLKDRQAPRRGDIERMNASLLHRGPDAQGIQIRPGVALGHTRLSILDVASGQQPMFSSDRRYCIVFNGEIYNYKALRQHLQQKGICFKTRSDTEVILQLYQYYGQDCLLHLEGMFAFAIHDIESNNLFLARDRLGIKPLFFYQDKEILIVASEIKAIFASRLVEPRFDLHSIKNYFKYQFSISPNTIFESIMELPPGYFMSQDSNKKFKQTRYWDLNFPKHNEYESYSESYWLSKFSSFLAETTVMHTTGDVEVASYLSGGIDSCAMTSLLSDHYRQKLRTFSIGFRNPQHDESCYYKKIAEHLGISNTEMVMEDSQEGGYLNLFRNCLYHLEQPQRMAVDIPHYLLSDLVRKNDVKVVVTGDGADEILAGYDCYRQDSMRTGSNGLLSSLFRKRTYLKEYTQYFSENHMRLLLKLHSRSAQRKTIDRFGFYPAWFDFWQITDQNNSNLFTNEVIDELAADTQLDCLLEEMQPGIQGRHPLNQSLLFETKTRLPGWILWKSDRLSMAHGVEARVPFMDHKLVELAAGIPPDLKLNGMDEKYILKKMMAPKLPELPGEYKKRGFYTPIREWFFSADRHSEVEPYLSFDKISETKIFNPEMVDSLYTTIRTQPNPDCMNSYYRTMQIEWILLLVLSVQLLHELFIEKRADCFNNISLKKNPCREAAVTGYQAPLG